VTGDVPEHDHVVKAGKTELSLADLVQLQPGLARLMPEVGVRVWKCWYAGQARNQRLARFQLKEAVNLLKLGAMTRPKYRDDLDAYIGTSVARVMAAIEAPDWDAFDAEFTRLVDEANDYHEKYDKGFLVWKVPDAPPPDLDMTPRE